MTTSTRGQSQKWLNTVSYREDVKWWPYKIRIAFCCITDKPTDQVNGITKILAVYFQLQPLTKTMKLLGVIV